MASVAGKLGSIGLRKAGKAVGKKTGKLVAKKIAKKVVKSGIKGAVKKGAKKGIKKGAKKAAKKGIKKGAKKLVKKGTKKAMKKAKKGIKKAAKGKGEEEDKPPPMAIGEKEKQKGKDKAKDVQKDKGKEKRKDKAKVKGKEKAKDKKKGKVKDEAKDKGKKKEKEKKVPLAKKLKKSASASSEQTSGEISAETAFNSLEQLKPKQKREMSTVGGEKKPVLLRRKESVTSKIVDGGGSEQSQVTTGKIAKNNISQEQTKGRFGSRKTTASDETSVPTSATTSKPTSSAESSDPTQLTASASDQTSFSANEGSFKATPATQSRSSSSAPASGRPSKSRERAISQTGLQQSEGSKNAKVITASKQGRGLSQEDRLLQKAQNMPGYESLRKSIHQDVLTKEAANEVDDPEFNLMLFRLAKNMLMEQPAKEEKVTRPQKRHKKRKASEWLKALSLVLKAQNEATICRHPCQSRATICLHNPPCNCLCLCKKTENQVDDRKAGKQRTAAPTSVTQGDLTEQKLQHAEEVNKPTVESSGRTDSTSSSAISSGSGDSSVSVESSETFHKNTKKFCNLIRGLNNVRKPRAVKKRHNECTCTKATLSTQDPYDIPASAPPASIPPCIQLPACLPPTVAPISLSPAAPPSVPWPLASLPPAPLPPNVSTDYTQQMGPESMMNVFVLAPDGRSITAPVYTTAPIVNQDPMLCSHTTEPSIIYYHDCYI
ncbi:hypothetical protein CLF_104733 [Clonorchis sinensis]|uniref:Uncharacterized protein n=1 Tax=Clonorchis sinensis TaxID=79923 RepID=H2KQU7_CLOSI|nr:hypothetical protein CLF_104733 [Clonorchis sinensis]